jgi:hypothetical protein
MSGIRTHERIELGDSWGAICLKLSDGNPGAIMTCTELLRHGPGYELSSPLGVLQSFLAIDSAALFGEKLYLLRHDLCGDHLVRMLTVLRALDLGLISTEALHAELEKAAEGEPAALDHEALLAGVRERWPDFGKERDK